MAGTIVVIVILGVVFIIVVPAVIKAYKKSKKAIAALPTPAPIASNPPSPTPPPTQPPGPPLPPPTPPVYTGPTPTGSIKFEDNGKTRWFDITGGCGTPIAEEVEEDDGTWTYVRCDADNTCTGTCVAFKRPTTATSNAAWEWAQRTRMSSDDYKNYVYVCLCGNIS